MSQYVFMISIKVGQHSKSPNHTLLPLLIHHWFYRWGAYDDKKWVVVQGHAQGWPDRKMTWIHRIKLVYGGTVKKTTKKSTSTTWKVNKSNRVTDLKIGELLSPVPNSRKHKVHVTSVSHFSTKLKIEPPELYT